MNNKSMGIFSNHHWASNAHAYSSLILIMCAACFPLLCFTTPTSAEVTWSGDLDPADPTIWDEYTEAFIGKTSSGVMGITSDSDIFSVVGYIGHESDAIGEVTVDGIGSTWTNSFFLFVGNSGSGTLNITGGGAVSNNDDSGYIGEESGSTGEVTVDGTNSTWTIGEDLYVGNRGSGTLNIADGGAVSNRESYIGYESGSTGAVSVNGTGSTWTNEYFSLTVGGSGEGTMDITSGGVVSNEAGYIGLESGSTGEVTVDGSGSTWTSSLLFVGGKGSGTLGITGGGTVDSDLAHIATNSGSTGEVTVDGVDSIWTNDSNIYVGFLDNGVLNITGGGAVSSGGVAIGYDSGSTGEVTVNGTGSTLTGTLIVGEYGGGVLNITGGGAVNSSSGYIGVSSGSTGEVTVDGPGSIWTVGGVGDVENFVVGYRGSGVLNITNGGVVINNNFDDSYLGYSSTGEVTVDGVGSMWTNSSGLYVGTGGRGILNITGGGLVSVGGTLALFPPDEGGGFINMAGGGMLALMGDADDSLVSFLGLINVTDAIRYWDYALGDWADIAGGTMGVDYTLSYITTPGDDLLGYTVLTVLEVALLDGDANRDGVVSAGDFASVQANFGSTGIAGIHGDANGDGVVSVGDYASVQMNFGNAATAQVTPEPATLFLLALGGFAMLKCKKRAK